MSAASELQERQSPKGADAVIELDGLSSILSRTTDASEVMELGGSSSAKIEIELGVPLGMPSIA
jgi:uncharacterized protein YbjQ (UPF0145 family)